jgi:integrase
MANANTPIMALQQWLGHRNSAMVMHYYHLNSADAKKLMSSIRLLPRSEQIPGND